MSAVVKSLYSGQLPLTLYTVSAYREVALQLEFTRVAKHCLAWVQREVSLDNVCTLHGKAVSCMDGDTQQYCVEFMSTRQVV